MKNLNRYFLLILAVSLLSCGPKGDNSDKHQDNAFEIQKLSDEISSLHKEIKTIQEQEIAGPDKNEDKSDRKVIDTSQFATKQELADLKVQMQQMIVELYNELDQKLIELNEQFSTFKKYMNDNEDKYVEISDFQMLVKDMEKNYALRTDVLRMQLEQTTDAEALARLRTQYESHIKNYNNEKDDYKEYFDKSIKAWITNLVKLIKDSNNELSTELKKYITNEISRVKVQQESILEQLEAVIAKQIQFEKDLDSLRLVQGREVTNSYSDNIVNNLENEIKELKQLLKDSKVHLDLVSDKIEESEMPSSSSIVNDITRKLYSPCYDSLKKDKYCFTTGTLINKLGGQFLDPTKFERTQKDLIRYFTLSGITLPAIINKTSNFLIPSPSNRVHFRTCHANDNIEGLIPPTKLWPRGVFLSLVFEKITKDLNKQLELNSKFNNKLVDPEIRPFNSITSWWRSECYHRKISDTQTGDHVYAAAFDPTFKNHKSYVFYKDYAFNNIWKNDTFGIRYPLESVQFGFSIGIGHGDGKHGNGKMHLGVGSPLKGKGQLRQWTY